MTLVTAITLYMLSSLVITGMISLQVKKTKRKEREEEGKVLSPSHILMLFLFLSISFPSLSLILFYLLFSFSSYSLLSLLFFQDLDPVNPFVMAFYGEGKTLIATLVGIGSLLCMTATIMTTLVGLPRILFQMSKDVSNSKRDKRGTIGEGGREEERWEDSLLVINLVSGIAMGELFKIEQI